MTVLKWLLIVVSVGYACGLAALFLAAALVSVSDSDGRRARRRRRPVFRKPKSMC